MQIIFLELYIIHSPHSRFLHLFSILPTHFVLLSKWDRFAVTWTVMKAEKSTFKKKWCIRNTDITHSWQERQQYRGCLYLCDDKNRNVTWVTLYVSKSRIHSKTKNLIYLMEKLYVFWLSYYGLYVIVFVSKFMHDVFIGYYFFNEYMFSKLIFIIILWCQLVLSWYWVWFEFIGLVLWY